MSTPTESSVPIEITESAVAAAVEAALAAIATATTVAELHTARTEHTAERSQLAQFNALIKVLPPERKAAAGKLVGAARARVGQQMESRESELAMAQERARLDGEAIDVTAVAARWNFGARHPLSLLMERMADVFLSMGWEVVEGPELENAWFNFDSLNMDEDHPARSEQDTFFVDSGSVDPVTRDEETVGFGASPSAGHLVLRTQTSPVQIRSLLSRELPLYVVSPGKVFRKDELDATHTPVFHQIEGIAIDKGLTMAHLRGTLEHLARAMFGDGAQIRLRPNYFPFTEPSAEMDVWQPNAKGGARWVEWGGCGMVNRKVLSAAGVDPDDYQGFAFGMGIERTLQFRNEMNDMRDMVEGDIRFSQQFGMIV
ncbi:MAG: phenylalanine--tRNA ligase subunit alpha [Rhodoglobus sp.]